MPTSSGPEAAPLGRPSGDQPGTGAHGAQAGMQSGAKPPEAAWAATLSDFVISTVGRVRDQATVKAVIVLRALVYGMVIVAGSVTALLLLIIAVVRIWDVYIPLDPVGRRVWLGYVVLGGALFLAGALLLSSSRKKARQ